MRTTTVLTQAAFSKDRAAWETVALPHTWNALDGQDGGGDYYRGVCCYKIPLPKPTPGKRAFIQFEGANHIAAVSCNGTFLGVHEGGFSTFRFELTQALRGTGSSGSVDNLPELLEVEVDNRRSHVYPQQADFTFYGGLYRNTSYIEVEPCHFDLTRDGSSGVFITPGESGEVRVEAYITLSGSLAVTDASRLMVECLLTDEAGQTAAIMSAFCPPARPPEVPFTEKTSSVILEGRVQNPRLWHGRRSPCRYTARLRLVRQTDTEPLVLDALDIPFGFRSFHVDPEQGFFLNGEAYPLHGVSRHQDREDKGWALTEQDQAEDMALIEELGANAIRLAHYQHSQCFYDLCDRSGMVVWTEIPFISLHIPGEDARRNTLSQLREMILQNYNHPSVCFWGLSNEISIGGETPEILENLKALQALAKELDPTRLTAMAQVMLLPEDSPHNQVTDVLGYNHYFGWYVGTVADNGPWLDGFHAKYPGRSLALSEYGCEAILRWHSAQPRIRDYSEEYQAGYHEELLKTFATRSYLWCTYVWNMFDFAADSRDEGGVKGRNHKGLVTYDRKVKKDAYYIYKAYWSEAPFVHICGRRFQERGPGQRDIKVYSNLRAVTLRVNGQGPEAPALFCTLEGDKVFVFPDVELRQGENTVEATAAGGARDVVILTGVARPNPVYVYEDPHPQTLGVVSWFEDVSGLPEVPLQLEFPEGYYSIKNSLLELLGNPEAAEIAKEYMEKGMGLENPGPNQANMGFIMNMPLEQQMKFAADRLPKGTAAYLNQKLTKIEITPAYTREGIHPPKA
ncbi:MAG: beta-galactosidase [Clostridiales bacterium]|nr:beta-galactosidase [Clostridiales bacterium]